MKSSKEQIKAVISKLPHIESRVPYTYHHDWMRTNIEKFLGCSRSDIASMEHDDYELYALALCQIIHAAYPCDIALTAFSDNDRRIIRECMDFAKEISKRLRRRS